MSLKQNDYWNDLIEEYRCEKKSKFWLEVRNWSLVSLLAIVVAFLIYFF